jgi:hypothetical protein
LTNIPSHPPMSKRSLKLIFQANSLIGSSTQYSVTWGNLIHFIKFTLANLSISMVCNIYHMQFIPSLVTEYYIGKFNCQTFYDLSIDVLLDTSQLLIL